MKLAVIQYPGSNCDYDVIHVLRNLVGIETELVWHRNFNQSEFDAAILPGGFSYGDYLRAGAIAAHSPSLNEVKEMSQEGKVVLGICNGFQILVGTAPDRTGAYKEYDFSLALSGFRVCQVRQPLQACIPARS